MVNMKHLGVHQGDCREVMKAWPDGIIDCVVTSPPYFGLRDYGTGRWEGGANDCAHSPANTPAMRGKQSSTIMGGKTTTGHAKEGFKAVCKCGARRIDSQIGLEESPQAFVEEMVALFREIRRVLKDDGTVWLNLGDSYAQTGTGTQGKNGQRASRRHTQATLVKRTPDIKPKDLIGIPWRVALALQADGWYLRQDIIWHKPNPMPESVTDRCTKAHEYIFLLTKSAKYHFDQQAILEPISASTAKDARLTRDGYSTGRPERGFPGSASQGGGLLVRKAKGNSKTFRGGGAYTGNASFDNSSQKERESHGNVPNETGLRNKRSVWTVSTKSFKGAHFATFPIDLITPCVLAGCRKAGVVLDPFCGSGTTGVVAKNHGRKFIGIELNPKYVAMAKQRISRAEFQPDMFKELG